MKRSVRRVVELPAFSIGMADLCLIWTRLDPLFDGDKDKSFYVEVEFDHETITLESIQELRSTSYPRSRTTIFTLHCHGTERGLHIYTPPHSGRQARLIVSAESEVWVAGAREVVLNIINQNRPWHNWLLPRALEWALLAMLMVVGVLWRYCLGLDHRPQQHFRPLLA